MVTKVYIKQRFVALYTEKRFASNVSSDYDLLAAQNVTPNIITAKEVRLLVRFI